MLVPPLVEVNGVLTIKLLNIISVSLVHFIRYPQYMVYKF